MPHLEYYLVAENAAYDGSTGELSLFHILSSLSVETLPTFIHKLVVVACFINTNEEVEEHLECQAQIKFRMPDGSEGRVFNANFVVETKVQHLVYRISQIPVQSVGEMKIALWINGNETAHHSIYLMQDDEESTESESE